MISINSWRWLRRYGLPVLNQGMAMRSPQTRSVRQALELTQRLAADRHLQAEIDKGMESLATGLPEPVGHRLARVLTAVIEPAWTEHTSFQGDALFPIVAKRAGVTEELRTLLAELDREHAEIGKQHREVKVFLGSLIAGRRTPGAGLSTCLNETVALRRRHHTAEAVLAAMVPEKLDAADCEAFERWVSTRTASAFPVSLLLDFWD